MNWFEFFLGKWVVRQKWWIIIATVLIVFVAASGMQFLTITNDSRVFFSEKNPQLHNLEALEKMYTKDQTVVFAIAPKDGDVFTIKTLSVIEELTKLSWKMPYSSRVDSISNFQHTRAEEDDLIVENFIENAKNFSQKDIKTKRIIALSEPSLVGSLISPSGHATSIIVTSILPGKSLEEVSDIAVFAHNLAHNFRQKYPEIDIYLTGSVISDNAFGEASLKDMATLNPIMFLVMIILVGIAIRSIIGTLCTSIIILISMATGLGLAGRLGIVINAASVSAPTLILTLSVADSVHLLTTIFHSMRLGRSKHEAIAESLRINLQTMFLTSTTTAIGFLTMNFSDVPPFRDLGNIVAMGIMAAFFYSILFLPSLIAILPVRVKAKPKSQNSTGCDKLANFVTTKSKFIFWGTLIIVAVMTTGLLRIKLNDNFIKYFDESFEFRKATDFLINNIGGWDSIEYSLNSGEPGGINNPEYMAVVDGFANWYRKQPRVVHVNTIMDTMKRLNKNMHADDKTYYRIPKHRDLAAQYLLLYEMSLPFGLDLNNQINVDKSSTRMTVTFKNMSDRELREADKRALEWLKSNAPEEMFTHGTGISMIWAHITRRNIKSMLLASFWALVLVSATLIFALRSFKLGLVSLIPNLVPALMAFGVWGMTAGDVGLALSIIVSMTIGIVVDDTIHFLSKYQRAKKENNMNTRQAIRYSFNTVGTAMGITTVALVAGFLVLTFSGYKMTYDMGMMSAITIAFALFTDFFLLPTLLIRIEG